MPTKRLYWRLFKEEIQPLLQRNEKEINEFRKDWLLESKVIKTNEDYQGWVNEIENKLKDRKMEIAYFEEEEGLTLSGYDITAIELFTLMEKTSGFSRRVKTFTPFLITASDNLCEGLELTPTGTAYS